MIQNKPSAPGYFYHLLFCNKSVACCSALFWLHTCFWVWIWWSGCYGDPYTSLQICPLGSEDVHFNSDATHGAAITPWPTLSSFSRLPRCVPGQYVKHTSLSLCAMITCFINHRLHIPHVLVLKSPLMNVLCVIRISSERSTSPGNWLNNSSDMEHFNKDMLTLFIDLIHSLFFTFQFTIRH